LPKAHVEAAVYGSMLLAAVLLKSEQYRLIHVERCLDYSFFIIRLDSIGALYMRLYRLIQVYIKIIVTYSSVVDINFITCSSFSLLKTGVIRRVHE
jgi:NADH:ubiquinone oxidoreductase subunit 4 (subunit M)